MKRFFDLSAVIFVGWFTAFKIAGLLVATGHLSVEQVLPLGAPLGVLWALGVEPTVLIGISLIAYLSSTGYIGWRLGILRWR